MEAKIRSVAFPDSSGLVGGSSGSTLLPPQSLPAAFEEVWVIEKAANAAHPNEPEISPGSGTLLARNGQNLLICPLRRTDVKADVTGPIASVNVSQTFDNPSREVAEAIYAFPLPEGAAVNEFAMTVGRRHIRGIIREQAEARQIYREAKSQGYLVSLLSQTQPNVFVQTVANLEPGKSIDIDIRYFQSLPYNDGWYSLTFPMISGPRGKMWPQPAERNGRDISIAVRLSNDLPIEKIESPTHTMELSNPDPKTAVASLTPADRIPNKDLILRYKPAGNGLRSSLVTQKTKDGGYFSLTLLPPDSWQELPRRSVELDVVMGDGTAAEHLQARQLAAAIVRNLKPDDAFLIASDRAGAGSALVSPLPVTPANLPAAESVNLPMASAGSVADRLRIALHGKQDESHLHLVCLLTTPSDHVPELLREMNASLGSARVIAVELTSTPDHGLIEPLAAAGRGAALYVHSGDDGAAMVSDLIERFAHPVLTDLAVNTPALTEILPSPTPDLLAGRAVVLTGRFQGTMPPRITVTGVTDAVRTRRQSIIAEPGPQSVALSPIWARMKLAGLLMHAESQEQQVTEQVRQICLEHGLVSQFTSFLCVDVRTWLPAQTQNPPPIQRTASGSM